MISNIEIKLNNRSVELLSELRLELKGTFEDRSTRIEHNVEKVSSILRL